MSVYLDGNILPSVGFSDAPTTEVSHSLARSLRIPTDKRLLLTTVVPGYPPFSTLVAVKFNKSLEVDIVLGSEWAGHLRESLISLDLLPPTPFVARHFLFPPATVSDLATEGSNGHARLGPVSRIARKKYNGSSDLNAQNYASGSSYPLPVPPNHRPCDESVVGFDASVASMLLSSGQSTNIFTASLPTLKMLLRSHHVPFDDALTVPDALHAIISHLLSGLCAGFCVETDRPSEHRCRCSYFSSVYGTRQAMAFGSLSLILSASMDRLPDENLSTVCAALGVQYTSRAACLNELGRRRLAIVSQHAAANPVLALCEKLNVLPKGTLVSVTQSHGLNTQSFNREQLLVQIWDHIGKGKCYKEEAQQSHLACSSVSSELDTDDDWDHADPSVRIQIQILRQLGPILKTAALRRLLELHDVSYVESDKVKVLRKRLKKFLYSLHTGKPSIEYGIGTRRAERARCEARLRENWPQVIPTHLKRKLLANFNFEVSKKALSTFVCGSSPIVLVFRLLSWS
ncbi:hypothetical protein C8R47DRAFT_1284796 [Mycena vitilis]|nr:hypothetical protein C8R47DRAFT_1284796 [Mycena vitilis]